MTDEQPTFRDVIAQSLIPKSRDGCYFDRADLDRVLRELCEAVESVAGSNCSYEIQQQPSGPATVDLVLLGLDPKRDRRAICFASFSYATTNRSVSDEPVSKSQIVLFPFGNASVHCGDYHDLAAALKAWALRGDFGERLRVARETLRNELGTPLMRVHQYVGGGWFVQ